MTDVVSTSASEAFPYVTNENACSLRQALQRLAHRYANWGNRLSLSPGLPFIWPEPRVSAGVSSYQTLLPFEAVARTATSIFGVVSAPDAHAVNWMEGYLADNLQTKLRLIVSVHPTCRTTESVLLDLIRLVERHGDRVALRMFPEASLMDRSSNMLCLCGPDGNAAITIGPTENMGLAGNSPSHANLVSTVNASTLEACRRWFDYLWGVSGAMTPELATAMPHLVVPAGDESATRSWEAYCALCLGDATATEQRICVTVDPETGTVELTDENDSPVKSPTEEIGVAKLDALV